MEIKRKESDKVGVQQHAAQPPWGSNNLGNNPQAFCSNLVIYD